ncbi:MAG: T9SS type A sorting domain-containing protein [Bacteroidales bacterium]|nr:T9SS type A sorting domain-containing protein [Bacteroidales bacterium]MCF8402348.1 T9SS type A sorting domain-containing protein [Bacteroidales bacterium]
MKKLLFSAVLTVFTFTTTFSQVFDSISQITPEHNIEDITSKGDLLFAACGEGGVWISSDDGFTWTQTATFPDAGFGQEAANAIYAASNGDIIVGGNLNYNGAALGGVVFRSSNNGGNWTFENFEGLAGYEKCEKIIELSDGSLMLHGGQSKLFISSLTSSTWTQTTAPGGVIFGFENINDEIFVVTNPSAGTAGTWVTSDLGITWERYGGNGTPVSGGTVTVAPIIKSGMYKFIGIGGAYDSHGVFRAGVNDTLWQEVNNGITGFGLYPICMATDNQTIWMVYQDAGGGCKFTSTTDFAENWTEPVSGGMPQQGVGGPCVPKMIVFKSHLYTFANKSVYRIEDVASPSSTGKRKYNDSSIEIFPNPTACQLNIKVKKVGNNGNWEIINLYGMVIKSGIINAHSNNITTVNVGDFPAGYHMLKTNVDGIISMNKFLKK